MSHLYRFLKGVIVLSILSSPFGGPLFILMMIVCSGGIGLIPLLPICYIAGVIAEVIISKIKGRQINSENVSNSSLSLDEQGLITNSQRSLMNNIWELKKRGVTKRQTQVALRKLGWNDDEIDEAHKLCKRSLL